MPKLNIIMAQLNPLVGDIDNNTELVIKTVKQAVRQHQADVVVFPELMLTGYPPEDLLLRPSMALRIERALRHLCEFIDDVYVIVGYPKCTDRGLFNTAGVFYQHRCIKEYHKRHLPNYQVFDEKRYFIPGDGSNSLITIRDTPVALLVCEDLWREGAMQPAINDNARLVICINASPFHFNKVDERQILLKQRVAEAALPIIYVNIVGGQDELVFDGGSRAMDAHGEDQVLAPCYETGLFPVIVDDDGERCELLTGDKSPTLDVHAGIYQALVLGLRDYVQKNGFKGVVLGLSGGMDSALTLAIACDALGADNVQVLMMPSRHTSKISIEDAEEQARMLDVHYQSLSIEPLYQAAMDSLADEFAGLEVDITEQNIQARCRAVLLMAVSNKKSLLVLSTGNKSELAVGYTTLYGDMVGGFNVLKDVAKTLVYRLARYRNRQSNVIPQRVIDRPPSAELAPGQEDTDTLPPYDILDAILERYVEKDYSAASIIADGFQASMVNQVIHLVNANEYKRRQAPIGVKVTQRAFGRDRRYPVTSGWKVGE